MASEPNGSEWRTVAPESISTFALPPDDERTTFVACSTYPAIDDQARFHLKVTKDVVHDMARSAVGKPIIDAHGFNDVHGGTVVAAAVDNQHRIWTVGALNYDTTGNSLKKRLRDGEFKGVSWRMGGIRYQHPIDKQLQVDKQFVNLSLAQKPEYSDTKIYFIGDDPFPVKKNRTMHNIERMLNETLTKKQTVRSTQATPSSSTNQTTAAAMTEANSASDVNVPAAATTNAAATPSANADVTPQQQQSKPSESAPQEHTEKKAPTEAAMQQPPPTTTTTSTTSQPPQQSLPPATQQQQPPQQSYVPQPPVINYNFGVPFTSQNQFGATTSVPSQSNLSTSDTQAPMSAQSNQAVATPAAPKQEKAEATATATQSDKTVEQAAASTPASYIPSKEFVEELRRSIVGEVRNLFGEFEKSRSTPVAAAASAAVPAAAAVPASNTTPAAQPTSTPAAESTTPSGPTKVQIDQIHAAISRIGQMRDLIAEQQRTAEALAPMQKTDDRLETESAIEAMKQEVLETTNALIEGVERHHSNYRNQFKISGNSIVDNEIARMKGKISQGQQLSQEDLRWLGTTIEITSESSFGHQRELEAAEQRLAAERRRFSSQVPTGAQALSQIDALRKVLGVDPRRETGVKRPAESSFAQEQKPKMSRADEFRKQFGIPWTPISSAELSHNTAPPPPTTSISSLSREYRINLMPVPSYQDSIFRTGLANDPNFSGLIAETRSQATKGVELTQTLSREGWEYVERMNK